MIWTFKQLPLEAEEMAGGKARVLARLTQAGYDVPPGFVITSRAFADEALREDAWQEVRRRAAALQGPFAVRSSALSEDSATASFAGEFETVLGVSGEEALHEAIHTVYASRHGARAAAYAKAQGLGGAEARDEGQAMSVIVQRVVPAALAGVLFTADPLSGSRARMTGNFVRGLGEKLVSGEVDGERFTLSAPKGVYEGPPQLKPHARRLFKLGTRLAESLGGPQDIEWAIAGGKLWLLQSRPISTMQAYDPRTGVWNDSRVGDYLWSNANFGEAIPGVMTPLTWSLVQIYFEETFGNPLPGKDRLMGNIGGRFYVNISLITSMLQALGYSRERINRESEELFGNVPGTVEIPVIRFTRWAVLRRFVPFAVRALTRRVRNLRRLDAFTADLPQQTATLQDAIAGAQTPKALLSVWQESFEPLLRRGYQMLQAGTSRYENSYRPLRRELLADVGEEDANLLLSGVASDGEHLASLGPLLGLWQVAHGEMSREEYLQRYGHRGPHEFEVSWPRPAEDPQWLDGQLAGLNGSDVPALLARRAGQKEAAWERYARRYPKKADGVQHKLAAAAAAARGREAIRSETTRLLAAARAFALRAGELTGVGEDVYYLRLTELCDLLAGEKDALSYIPLRRTAHERLSNLPPYPALISGRFDPFAWAADPGRRTDQFDAHAPNGSATAPSANGLVQGLPASAGVVEGTVRRLDHAHEGHLLQEGEILVAVTTNVGWTPLFPRAAAVVTDVGAPLSHAAIVARELGIPAVVGAKNATMRLQTGDRVRVDGTRGVVELE